MLEPHLCFGEHFVRNYNFRVERFGVDKLVFIYNIELLFWLNLELLLFT